MMQDKRFFRIKIFNENLELFEQGRYETPSGEVVLLPRPVSEFYSEPFQLEEIPPLDKCVIRVVNDDCIEVARNLVKRGLKAALLNMASLRHPGGGAHNGAGAQEEQLCRRSTLILSLYRYSQEMVSRFPQLKIVPDGQQYPMHHRWGGIFSEDILFFRESEQKDYTLSDAPFKADVISVAAINHPDLDAQGRICAEDALLTKDKMRTILRIAMEHGDEALVLGAMGCGAFANPPREIARLFHEVLTEKEFDRQFKEIVFAILEDRNSLRNTREGNFIPFKEEFENESGRDQ